MNLVDPKRLQKIILARKVGLFLEKDQSEDERNAVEGVARMLAEDVSNHVRSTLAFALRQTRHLSKDIAEKIARDAEDISSTFLAETPAFTDEELSRLIPSLDEFARIVIAKRSDLGSLSAISIASNGDEGSVTYLLRNGNVAMHERSAKAVAKRFVKNQGLLDELSKREDLPLVVVKSIIDRVSEECRSSLISKFKVAPKVADLVTDQTRQDTLWQRLKNASRQQIHALAVEQKSSGQLDFVTVLTMAEKGCLPFLESALAVSAELTLAEVRDGLAMEDPGPFIQMMRRANIGTHLAPRILKIARVHYAKKIA